MNLLLFALSHIKTGHTLMLEARTVMENRDKVYMAFVISTVEQAQPTQAQLLAIIDRLAKTPPYQPGAKIIELLKEQTNISLELAKTLIALHHGEIDISHSPEDELTIAVFFAGNRIVFSDSEEG